MGELANCPRCDALFVKGARSVCEKCFKEEEKAFRTVYDFLKIRKNRQATLMEIVEATGVEEELIIKFVKEKRLRTSQFPNLAYPCEKCGKHITDGRLCQDCADTIRKDIESHDRMEKARQQQKEKSSPTYFKF